MKDTKKIVKSALDLYFFSASEGENNFKEPMHEYTNWGFRFPSPETVRQESNTSQNNQSVSRNHWQKILATQEICISIPDASFIERRFLPGNTKNPSHTTPSPPVESSPMDLQDDSVQQVWEKIHSNKAGKQDSRVQSPPVDLRSHEVFDELSLLDEKEINALGSQGYAPYSCRLKQCISIHRKRVTKLIAWEPNAAFMLVEDKNSDCSIMKLDPSDPDNSRSFFLISKIFSDFIIRETLTVVSYKSSLEIFLTPDDFLSQKQPLNIPFSSVILGIYLNEKNELLVRTRDNYTLFNIDSKAILWEFPATTTAISCIIRSHKNYIVCANSDRYVFFLKRDAESQEMHVSTYKLASAATTVVIEDPWIFIGDKFGNLYYHHLDSQESKPLQIEPRIKNPVLNILTYPQGILVVTKTSFSFYEKRGLFLFPRNPPVFFPCETDPISILKQIKNGLVLINLHGQVFEYEN